MIETGCGRGLVGLGNRIDRIEVVESIDLVEHWRIVDARKRIERVKSFGSDARE